MAHIRSPHSRSPCYSPPERMGCRNSKPPAPSRGKRRRLRSCSRTSDDGASQDGTRAPSDAVAQRRRLTPENPGLALPRRHWDRDFPQLLRPDREWDDIMSRSDRPRHADTFLSSPSDGYSPWPITSGELASLVDLGLSDNRIARYFGVEPVKVSALRDYYGLVDAEDP
jgi:hypothetical protein